MVMNETILELIEEKKFSQAKDILASMNEVDIATLLCDVDSSVMVLLFRLLPKALAADVFAFLSPYSQELIISAISDTEVSTLLNLLFVDDIADLIEEVPSNIAGKILKNATEDKRKTINQILQYPENSSGSILTTEYIRLKKNMTVAEALETIRVNAIKKETIYTCYITDENRFLQGVVSLRDLVLSEKEKSIEEIMTKDVISVRTIDDREIATDIFKKYNFIALPVVDNENRLVGIITVDDIMDVLEEETTEDFQKMAAIAPSDDKYLETPVLSLAKHRIFWLMFLMLSGTLISGIIEHFTSLLEKCVILTAFMPIIMDTGGNSGNQASTLIVRGLGTGEIHTSDFLSIMWKEFRIGLLVSVILSIVMFIKNFFLAQKDFYVSLTVSCALMVSIIIAKLTGSILPVIAKKLKLDPATMASPMLTTVVDIISLIVFFSFAKLFIPELSAS